MNSSSAILGITERRFLSKASRMLRNGQNLTIGFPDHYIIDKNARNALADIAVLASRAQAVPTIRGVTASHAIELEVTGLSQHFVLEAAPEKPAATFAPPATTSPLRLAARLMVGVACVVLAIGLAGCSGSGTTTAMLNDGVRITPTADVPGQVDVPARVSHRCEPFVQKAEAQVATEALLQRSLHGPGDVLRIDVKDGEDFSGLYTVNYDGTVSLPLAGRVKAEGRSTEAVQDAVRDALVNGGYFHAGQLQVAVLPMRWAPMNISVSGAVFLPGRAVINDPSAEKRDPESLQTIGDAPMSRFIDAGLRAGAGIRPDADLSRITLIRAGRHHEIDLTGLVTGLGAPDVPLMAGDRLEVPSSGCFHAELMRPSQATPPGFRVFMSNLTVPATGNNPSAIDNYATNLPYGTKLLQAVTSANCIGGAKASNASRHVVLMSNNPLTGKTEIIERSIENLLRHANDERANPYMLPNDALACYDSGVTNVREVARTLSEVLGPLGFVIGLL